MKNTVLDDLAAVIGFSATLRLAAWYGDGVSNLYIPEQLSESSTLVKLIGKTAAQRLIAEWPGQHIHVPYITDYEVDVRRRAIARMLERGFGTREIAAVVRMSERRVQQICRELEIEGLIPVVGPLRVSKRSEESETTAESTLENWMGSGG